MDQSSKSRLWESIDAAVCAFVVAAMAWGKLITGHEAVLGVVAISGGRSGLLVINSLLARAFQLPPPPPGGNATGNGNASPPAPPSSSPPQLPTSPLAILFALMNLLVRVKGAAVALVAAALAGSIVACATTTSLADKVANLCVTGVPQSVTVFVAPKEGTLVKYACLAEEVLDAMIDEYNAKHAQPPSAGVVDMLDDAGDAADTPVEGG